MTDMQIEFRTFANMGKPDADVPVMVVQVGERGQLDTKHASDAAQGILKARETYPAATIVLVVNGYDEDKRELWDVPEVCDYMVELFDKVFADWPEGGLADLNLEPNSMTMVLVCTGVMRVTGRDPATGNYLLRLRSVGRKGSC